MAQANIKEQIVSEIIKGLEAGLIPWKQPYTTRKPVNHAGKAYKGINTVMLWMKTASKGYTSNQWVTFLQCKKLNGSVKAGEKGTPIFYYEFKERLETLSDGSSNKRTIPLAKIYYVFNLNQTTISISEPELIAKPELATARLELLKGYVNSPQVITAPGTPCYIPSKDLIQMPELKDFTSEEEYTSTLTHELIHSTGAETRLNREGVRNVCFGSSVYSEEELIAEIGAAFLNSDLGIYDRTKTNSQAYINNWIKALQDKPGMIFKAAARAEKAAEYIKKRGGVAA